jgi:sugar lactone lactonase YvrE
MFDLHGWCLDTFGGNSKKDGTIGKGVKIKADESNVYVMDTYYHNIHKYAYSGKEEEQIGDEGKEPGKFIEPADMALDGKGSLYVLDSKLKRVSIFNPKGRFTGSFESAPDHSIQMDEPLRLTVSKDGMFVYVYDGDLYTVLKYNREGNLLSHYGQKGAKETGQFYYVDSMGVDESGCLVVAEPRYNRVQKIDFRGAAGQPMMQFHRETALAQKADLFAVHPAGILVVYSDDSSLMLFD